MIARLCNAINQILDISTWFNQPADRLWEETTSHKK